MHKVSACRLFIAALMVIQVVPLNCVLEDWCQMLSLTWSHGRRLALNAGLSLILWQAQVVSKSLQLAGLAQLLQPCSHALVSYFSSSVLGLTLSWGPGHRDSTLFPLLYLFPHRTLVTFLPSAEFISTVEL